ncbi:A kinase (PRKA) anchor protein 14 [Burkholderia ambifaria IOP40-10]|uniref:A kinase (PRKA) anchor protein 14 n=1 Tax=Burkholderia ambifaria IOP40-10 TaxID=396596 RepID=B1FQ26_9BURK|nr:A kinase (PRKA) anchor protein 14 [Burkholderia ambifaria IOP40-10]
MPAAPASEPIVCAPVAPARSNVAPAPVRLTVPVDARLPPAPSASVPLLIVVSPVYVFAPVSVVVAVPFFTSPPVPLIVPARPSALLPPSVSVAPVARLTALPSVTFVLVSSDADALTFSAPVPSAPLLPTTRPPAFRFVPPV